MDKISEASTIIFSKLQDITLPFQVDVGGRHIYSSSASSVESADFVGSKLTKVTDLAPRYYLLVEFKGYTVSRTSIHNIYRYLHLITESVFIMTIF